jgi:hypothetical protein
LPELVCVVVTQEPLSHTWPTAQSAADEQPGTAALGGVGGVTQEPWLHTWLAAQSEFWTHCATLTQLPFWQLCPDPQSESW